VRIQRGANERENRKKRKEKKGGGDQKSEFLTRVVRVRLEHFFEQLLRLIFELELGTLGVEVVGHEADHEWLSLEVFCNLDSQRIVGHLL